jgi:hypothetical protein
MKNVKFYTDGIDQWINREWSHGHLPLADFVANGVKEGFRVIRVQSKAMSPYKSRMGHSHFPVQSTASDAVRVTLERLREEGKSMGDVFAFRMPDGRYEYHKV